MKKYAPFWLLGLLLIIWYYFQKINAARALLFGYKLPRNIKISGGALTFELPVMVTNPTGTPIFLQRYNVQIYVNGYPVGTAYSIAPITIEPGGVTALIANVAIGVDSLLSAIPTLISGSRQINFRFAGSVSAELIRIPIDTTVPLLIPKL